MRLFTFSVLFAAACSSSEKTEVADADGDGFSEVEDCDDNNAAVYPGATDNVGDDIDQNCDNLDGVDADTDGIASVTSGGEDCNDNDVSEEASALQTFYQDADGDGFGNANLPEEGCEIASGMVENGDDCDDSNAEISPDASEICDERDNDCDGRIDDEDDALEGGLTFYGDTDGDGFGDASNMAIFCFATTTG